MLKPFFAAAMIAPGRQAAFRRVAVGHVLLVAILAYAAGRARHPDSLVAVGYFALILGMVEGAALVGWRLTQMPKSQALEFLLTSPVQPRRVFLAEALVGIARFALVWLAGLPVFAGLVFTGAIDPGDLAPLAVMPFAWGVACGVVLTAWVYEPVSVRRVGELIGLGGVLVYLVVGVLAAERLADWLMALPDRAGSLLFRSVVFLRDWNPFGFVKYWFDPATARWVAWERFEISLLATAAITLLAGTRAAFRLRGHFHDRHYKPIDSSRESQLERIGDRPLSWWAVRRVMEYSGRVNLWLAGGFCLLYAAYLVAGDHWPAWMGRLVFVLFERWGGAPMVAAAMAVMAAVPAVFQFGLWDPTVQDRCKRLELLLLTDLVGRDYWHASLSASWKRGRGYLFAAGVLWLALGVSSRNTWAEVLAAAGGGGLLWAFSFTVGFRAFATGNQTNGLASLMTVGMPLVLFGLVRAGLNSAAALVPPGLSYTPVGLGLSWAWLVSAMGYTALIVWLTRQGLRRCDADLRRWYDANQGKKSVE